MIFSETSKVIENFCLKIVPAGHKLLVIIRKPSKWWRSYYKE